MFLLLKMTPYDEKGQILDLTILDIWHKNMRERSKKLFPDAIVNTTIERYTDMIAQVETIALEERGHYFLLKSFEPRHEENWKWIVWGLECAIENEPNIEANRIVNYHKKDGTKTTMFYFKSVNK